MAETFLTPEQGVELKKLRGELATVQIRQLVAISEGGMDSRAFLQAEAERAVIVRQIKQLLGTSTWMSAEVAGT